MNTYDQKIGARIREVRIALGWTQSQLADAVGNTTYQQIHKIEKGLNRVSVGQAYLYAKAFGIDVSEFYAELDNSGDPLSRRTFAMMKMFAQLPEKEQRALFKMASAMLGVDDADAAQNS